MPKTAIEPPPHESRRNLAALRYIPIKCAICKAAIIEANRRRGIDRICDGCLWIAQSRIEIVLKATLRLAYFDMIFRCYNLKSEVLASGAARTFKGLGTI
jgi:hypothetical protein